MAELSFTHAQMGAGKTASLLLTAFHLKQSGARVVVLTCNDRKEGQVTSRIGLAMEAVALDPAIPIAQQVERAAGSGAAPSHILVDEAQFLSPSQVDELSEIVDTLGVDVNCYGLRSDFTGQAFAGSAHLFASSDRVHALQVDALCWCGKVATHNARAVAGEVQRRGAQIVIDDGGSVRYHPLCRRHWKEGDIGQPGGAHEEGPS